MKIVSAISLRSVFLLLAANITLILPKVIASCYDVIIDQSECHAFLQSYHTTYLKEITSADLYDGTLTKTVETCRIQTEHQIIAFFISFLFLGLFCRFLPFYYYMFVCFFILTSCKRKRPATFCSLKTLTTNPIKNYLNKVFHKSYRNLKLFCQVKKLKRLYISQPIREYLICKC